MNSNVEKDKQRRSNLLLNLYKNNKFSEAIDYSVSFMKDFPTNASGYNIYALSKKKLGDIEGAITFYEALINRNPNNVMFLTNLANIYSDIGHLDKAVELFNRSIVLDPKAINAYNGLGNALVDLGRNTEARDCYLKILKFEPSNESCHYNLAEIYRKIPDYELAIEHYSKSNHKLSNSHHLECLYLFNKKNKFLERLDYLNSIDEASPLIGSISAHSSIRYNLEDNNLFCKKPLNYISHSALTTNEGFSDQLIEDVISFHDSDQANFRSQALIKNGKQSAGNLFLSKVDCIQSIKKIIENRIEDYRKKYNDSDDGFIKKWPKNYDLYGWIISLKDGGKLSSHIHKLGWMSGSLYLNLPKKKNDSSGNIVFSLDGVYPNDGKEYPKKEVNINKRDIVLFPSSVFHQTVPFSSDENRITLAFDIKPHL